MADVEKTVKILFQGDDQLSKKVKGIMGSLDAVSGGIERFAAPFAKLTKGIMAVDTALLALTAGGLYYAFEKSKGFETATVSLKKILGEEADQIDKVSVKVLEMSNTYGEAATAIMDTATEYKRAGFSLNELLILTKNTLDLVIGASEAEVDAARATEIIIATLKGFKAPASEAERLINVLNIVSNKYATSVNELGTGMAELSPIAAKMGFSFEQTAGIVTPIIEIFRSGSEASAALRMGLLKLVDDAKPVRDALKSIGVSQTDTNGQLRSGKDILFDVAKAFTTLDDNQKLFVASQLVGIRQAAKMVEVFDGLRYTTEITNVAMQAGNSIQKEVAARLETSQKAADRLRTGFQNLGIAVGDEFRDAASGTIDGLTAIENVLERLTREGAFDAFFDQLRDMGFDLEKVFQDIAATLPKAFELVGFSGLLDSMDKVGAVIGNIFNGFDPKDPEDIAKAIQFMVETLRSLVDVSRGIAESLSPFISIVGNIITKFNELDTETKGAFGRFLANMLVIDTLGAKLGILATLVGASTMDMTGAFDELSTLGGHYLGELEDDTVSTGEAVKETTKTVEELKDAIIELPESKETKITVSADSESAREIEQLLKLSDAEFDALIAAEVDEGSVQEVTEVINQVAKPKEAKIDISLDIARIKAQADIVQSSIEWKAKVDIARVMSATDIMKAAFSSINKSIESTGSTLSSLWEVLAGGGLQMSQRWALEDTLRNEENRRQESFELQKELTDAQIDLTKAKTEAMERGDAMITIDGAGLQPHLEAFMWEILEAIQVRANAEGSEFLLGI